MFSLGFLGSFGHCVGMCGSLTAAFSLSWAVPQQPCSQPHKSQPSIWQQLRFHGLLNLGRIISYTLVGMAIGTLGSVLIAGGQLAGVGSVLRRGMSLLTGSLLIWFALIQLNPGMLPKIPFLNPMAQSSLHQRLSTAMVRLSLHNHWWTPILLGLVWGLIPCGFLYAAQIKAAETGNLWQGGATMLAFGLGTLSTMMGIGVSTALVSGDRRSQLFRMGGWVTLVIGILTLLRTGDTMVDYTGHAALICLMLALVARPISRFWAAPLRYRRVIGVAAFVLSLAHTLHMLEHTWSWNLDALSFMLPQQQWSIAAGVMALSLMIPPALTSFDGAQRSLGQQWRRIHLLSIPVLVLSAAHAIAIGSHYLGSWNSWNQTATCLLIGTVCFVLLIRLRWIWSLLSLEKFYVSSTQIK
jgi:uncharacterized protein